jgi:hypothetical protein
MRVARAFRRNARSWWPFFAAQPVGWSRGVRRRLDQVLSNAHAAVQELNDRYADPSGRSHASEQGGTNLGSEPTVTQPEAADVSSAIAAEARIDTDIEPDADADLTLPPPTRDERRFGASRGRSAGL